MYYLAEIKRIFNCKSLDKLESSIQTALKDSKSLTGVNDLYHAFILNQNAKLYGSKSSDEFTKFITTKGINEILEKFNGDTWAYDKSEFSLESLRAAEILSAFLPNNTKAESKIKSGLAKLLVQAYEDE